jgi:hypothetical protein
MKIRPIGAELFYANRWTDRHDEANSPFRTFANAPENNQLMLYGKVIGNYSENHTQH